MSERQESEFLLCFCVFKQKTADEVRIGDWSSDVCSSDLRAGVGLAGLVDQTDFGAESGAGNASDGPPHSRKDGDLTMADNTEDKKAGKSSTKAKIGRASCRERVCQYV